MIRAAKPITFGEHQGAQEAGWEITLGTPDRVDAAQGPQYVVDVDVLAQHDGLDRALVDAGLQIAQTIPWGTRGPQLVFLDRRPTRTVGSYRQDAPPGLQRMVLSDEAKAQLAGVSRHEDDRARAAPPSGGVADGAASFQTPSPRTTLPAPLNIDHAAMDLQTQVMQLLRDGPVSWLDLIRRTRAPMKHLSQAVQALKRDGLIVQEGKEYRRAG